MSFKEMILNCWYDLRITTAIIVSAYVLFCVVWSKLDGGKP